MSQKTAILTGVAVAAGFAGGEAAAAPLPTASPAAVAARFDPSTAELSGSSFGKRDPLVLSGLQIPQDPPPAVGGAVKSQGPASQPSSKPTQDPVAAPANAPDPTVTEVAKVTGLLLNRLRTARNEVVRTITTERVDDADRLALTRKFFDGGVPVLDQRTGKVETIDIARLIEGTALQTRLLRDFARVLAIVQSNPEMMAEIAKWDVKKDLDPQLKSLVEMRCTNPLVRAAYRPGVSADVKAQAIVAGTIDFFNGAAIPASERIQTALTAAAEVGKSLSSSYDLSKPKELADARRSVNLSVRAIDGVLGHVDSSSPVIGAAACLCENLAAVYMKYAPKPEAPKAGGAK